LLYIESMPFFTANRSQGTSIAQHIALFVSLSRGLARLGGPLEDQIDVTSIEAALLASNILFLFTHAGAKISMAILTRRLFDSYQGSKSILCNGLIGITVLWPVLAVLIIFPGCSVANLSTPNGKCDGLLARWVVVALVDCVSEIVLTLVPALLVRGLMMSNHSKITVIAAFAPRLILLVFSGVLASTVHDNLNTDPNMAYLFLVIFTQMILCWSLISASLPCFRAFIRPFDAVVDHTSYPTDHGASAAGNLYRGAHKITPNPTYGASNNVTNEIKSGVRSKRRSTDEARLLGANLEEDKVIRVDFRVDVS